MPTAWSASAVNLLREILGQAHFGCKYGWEANARSKEEIEIWPD